MWIDAKKTASQQLTASILTWRIAPAPTYNNCNEPTSGIFQLLKISLGCSSLSISKFRKSPTEDLAKDICKPQTHSQHYLECTSTAQIKRRFIWNAQCNFFSFLLFDISEIWRRGNFVGFKSNKGLLLCSGIVSGLVISPGFQYYRIRHTHPPPSHFLTAAAGKIYSD